MRKKQSKGTKINSGPGRKRNQKRRPRKSKEGVSTVTSPRLEDSWPDDPPYPDGYLGERSLWRDHRGE